VRHRRPEQGECVSFDPEPGVNARRKSLVERTLAGLVSASLVLSLLLAPLAGARAGGSRDCPPAGDAQSVLVPATGHGCHHADVGVCLAALGCTGVAPALYPPVPSLAVASPQGSSAPVLTSRLADFLPLGPPTPPPNS
jgi:hypothetical protein